MKKSFSSICLLFFLSFAAQSAIPQDSTLFDFWVGDWNLEWTNADGTKSIGFNKIEKTLDGKVIQENFRDTKTGFKGTSISVYNRQQKIWHQAWADNQGGYFDFEGAVDGEKRIFKTKEKEVNGNKVTQRMVFYNIQPNSMTWDWELTKDGGKSWQLQWRILYTRKK